MAHYLLLIIPDSPCRRNRWVEILYNNHPPFSADIFGPVQAANASNQLNYTDLRKKEKAK